MRVPQATIALLAVAVLALGAGVVAGTLGKRVMNLDAMVSSGGSDGSTGLGAGGSSGLTAGGSTLSQELGLSAEQRDRMQRIWEGVRDTAHECQEQAQQLQKQRDDAVFAMLTDEQKVKYTQLTTECVGKVGLLNSRREAAFGNAVAETKSILSESQRKIYEQMIESRVGQHVSIRGENQPAQAFVMR